MVKRFLLCSLLSLFFLISAIDAKPPSLTTRDTKAKIEEILRAHVSYQQLTPDLMKRSFENYIDELDPGKTYFLESEVSTWISPSEETMNQALKGIPKEDFQVFEEIHSALIRAVERRNVIELQIDRKNLPKNVKSSEFKNLAWCQTEEELKSRIEKIKSLQSDTASKLSQNDLDQFMERIEKRRVRRESEMLPISNDTHRQTVLSYVLKSVSSALDSQTHYFTPLEANQFMQQLQQKLYGIGAQLRDDLNGLTIVRLIEGGPASISNKIRVGDRIIAVDGQAIIGMDITEAVEMIRGEEGTAVNLTILRESYHENNKEEEKLDIEITRGEVVLTESRYASSYEPFGDGIIAHISLFSFYQDEHGSSQSDLEKAIQALKSEHKVYGVILDMRNNGGGLLPQAVAVCSLFMKKGVVVSIKDNTGNLQHLRNIEDKLTWDGPLLILTSRASASATEIVAQTLQEYGRALVVGDEKTYGKGTFQTFTLDNTHNGKINPKGEYKVTRGRYYTVSGKSPQLIGVHADVVIPGVYSLLDVGEEFSKFPLTSDQITPNFDDDLSDIPPVHRNYFKHYYKTNLQPIVQDYLPYLEILKENSAIRIKQNKNYQNFLKEIENQDYNSDTIEFFGQNDLQLVEAINIMKDLLLMQKQHLFMPQAAGG